MMTQNILFLCVANSARSQLAEGLARHYFGEVISVQSAGSNPATVNPLAIKVMQEIGIDMTAHYSKSVNDIDSQNIDLVITLCAEEVCPVFFGAAQKLHWPFSDPAAVKGSEEDQLQAFRQTRDAIKDKLFTFMSDAAMLSK